LTVVGRNQVRMTLADLCETRKGTGMEPGTGELTRGLEGYTTRGDFVQTITLQGSDGMTATLLTLGCRIVDLRLADGRPMVLSLPSLQDVEADSSYVGVAVGRTANRICAGRATVGPPLAAPELELNENGTSHLHGGRCAWDKRLFSVRGRGLNWVLLYLFSPEGDQGYPSAVEATVRYELRGEGALCIELSTRNVGDVDTITNMTVHPYFDLSGAGGRTEGAALDWVVHAPECSRYLDLDKGNLPTGQVRSVENSHLDFRKPRALGEKLQGGAGYDNFLVLDNYDARTAQMVCLVSVTAPGPGIRLDVESNQPGFQMYSADGFDGTGALKFAKKGSLAIEPSGYIDACNQAAFPSILLKPGQLRTQWMKFKFTCTP
jgi:aldose 1-epimerase